MRRNLRAVITGGLLLIQGGFVLAQSSLDTLEDELKEAQQHHDEVTSQTLDNFFSQVDAAMASPDAAVALYQQAGGTMPPPSPVVTTHTDETVTEKDARLALDQANVTRLGLALQLHCGMLHFGALFVVKPNQKGLQDAWTAWLKTAAAAYPQVNATANATDQNPTPHHHKGWNGSYAPSAPYSPGDIKGKALHDSIISKFLGFNVWGEKEQGNWTIQQLPKLYRSNVLDPSRTPPTADTLANWDAYIGMVNADVTDDDQWNQVVYPPLQFERACDDYTIAPDTEKLEGLINLIKANPTYPDVTNWSKRVKGFLDSYRASHGGGGSNMSIAPAPATNAPPANSNVSVTTQQQGDMTIVTTHTNAAPANTAPPAQ
jgi:hypothetical protein